MAKKDRFDSLPGEPGRVGAHRGKVRRGAGWVLWLLLALASVVVLAGAGFWAIGRFTPLKLDFDLTWWLPQVEAEPTPTPTETLPTVSDPQAVIDRGIQVMVLNGTPLTGLQDQVGQDLRNAGWPVGTTVNAGERDFLDTIVYYTDEADVDVARGLVQLLGLADEPKSIDPGMYPGQRIILLVGMDNQYCQADPSCAPPPVAPETPEEPAA